MSITSSFDFVADRHVVDDDDDGEGTGLFVILLDVLLSVGVLLSSVCARFLLTKKVCDARRRNNAVADANPAVKIWIWFRLSIYVSICIISLLWSFVAVFIVRTSS